MFVRLLLRVEGVRIVGRVPIESGAIVGANAKTVGIQVEYSGKKAAQFTSLLHVALTVRCETILP